MKAYFDEDLALIVEAENWTEYKALKSWFDDDFRVSGIVKPEDAEQPSRILVPRKNEGQS